MLRIVEVSLVLLLVVVLGGYLLFNLVKDSRPGVVDLDPYIEDLLNSEKGGVIILPAGEYSSSSIYGPEGLVGWGKPKEEKSENN